MSRHNHHHHPLKGIYLLLLVCTWTQNTQGYGEGAPSNKEVCQGMLPQHNQPVQTTPSPFQITLSNDKPMGGDKVKIVLSAPESQHIKGFLAMVKKPGDDSKNYGKFSVTSGPDVQAISCFGQPQSAATHVSPSEKKNITLEWIAPNDEDISELQLVATFVREWNEIWQAVPHPQKISVKKNLLAVAAPQKRLGDNTRQKLKEMYSGCNGDTKGCLGMPSGCIETFISTQDNDNPEVCKVMLSWSAEGTKNMYSMTGMPTGNDEQTTGYIAMGFSEDKSMGQDSVVGCYVSSTGGEPEIKRFYNPAKVNQGHSVPTLGLTALEKSFIEGHMFCKFEQTDHLIEDIDVKIRDKNYYILLSRGGIANADRLSQHSSSDDRAVTGQTLAITDTGIFGADQSRVLFQLHGAFMIVAWLLCASTGMFTARYYKLTHTDVMPFNKAFWFVVHLFCMFSTVFLTICGAIFIFIQKGGYFPKDGGYWHPILGTILFGLALCQVLIAFMRPHPNTKFRPLFNWIHWTIGNSAHIVGIACIFLANDLSTAKLNKKEYMFIMMSAVIFHIVMHLVMSFHTLWADKQMDSKTKRAVVPGPMKHNGLSTEAPGTGFRSFMMALYFLGLLGCAIALIVFVIGISESPADS